MARGDGNGSMGRPPNNLPMTFDQMVASNEARKPKKSDRRAILEANKQEISSLVGSLADRLEEANRKPKVNLQDTERVKEICIQYIRSCEFTGTLPTLAGAELALGCSPSAFKTFKYRNPNHETTKWINAMRDHFAELLGQAALDGDVAAIPAIFTLKARYNWNDQPEIEAKDNNDTEDLSPDTIAEKYDDLPD